MQDYSDFGIKTKIAFEKANTYDEKQQIIVDFVKKLRTAKLSNEEIKKISDRELRMDAQGNRTMISNNQAYNDALAKALGEKK